MLTLFKQKKSKYSSNNNEKSIYQKYYESYKNKDKNIKLLKQIHLNRIKYYEEAENENKDNYENKNDVLDKNKFNKNIFDNLNNNNTFFGESNSKENNDTLSTINKFTINSLNGKKCYLYNVFENIEVKIVKKSQNKSTEKKIKRKRDGIRTV